MKPAEKVLPKAFY